MGDGGMHIHPSLCTTERWMDMPFRALETRCEREYVCVYLCAAGEGCCWCLCIWGWHGRRAIKHNALTPMDSWFLINCIRTGPERESGKMHVEIAKYLNNRLDWEDRKNWSIYIYWTMSMVWCLPLSNKIYHPNKNTDIYLSVLQTNAGVATDHVGLRGTSNSLKGIGTMNVHAKCRSLHVCPM